VGRRRVAEGGRRRGGRTGGGPSSGHRLAQDGACAHTQTAPREGGERGRNGCVGGRRRRRKQSAAVGFGGGAWESEGGEIGAGRWARLLEEDKIKCLVEATPCTRCSAPVS